MCNCINAISWYWMDDAIIRAGFADRKTFAAYARVDEGNLSKLINGKVREPRVSTLVKISASLGISIDEMVRRAGYTNGSSAKSPAGFALDIENSGYVEFASVP